jgi:5-formyltetrahydrofolate cyclo-ligase
MTSKQSLRSQLIAGREAINSEQRLLFNQLIFERAHKTRAFQLARTVHVYRNLANEVATMPFLEYAWATGKRVVVPCMSTKHPSAMVHVCVTNTTLWQQGALGIDEPTSWLPQEEVHPEEFDATTCILVPLVGFDKACHRLGYGKGLYDAFLAQTTGAVAIGLAYELQRVDGELPREEHDVALHAVVTNERVYLP